MEQARAQQEEQNEKSVGAGVNPDQIQTLPMDLSPLTRIFYGAPVEKNQNFQPESQRATTDDSILNAKTRNLDSFAEVAEVEVPPQEEKDQEHPQEKEDEESEDSDDDGCKRNLNSVFDQEARGTKIGLLGQPITFTCFTLFDN